MAANKKSGTGCQLFRNERHRLLCILLFIVYFAVLFYFLFFAESMGRTYSERDYHYNLIPFREIKRFITHCEVLGLETVILNIVGNVMAFLPFGIFLPIISKHCRIFWFTLLYSFELSLLVELIQLVTKVGSFDVDDILLNTLGGVIGYLVYRAGIFFLKRKHNTQSTAMRGARQEDKIYNAAENETHQRNEDAE